MYDETFCVQEKQGRISGILLLKMLLLWINIIETVKIIFIDSVFVKRIRE